MNITRKIAATAAAAAVAFTGFGAPAAQADLGLGTPQVDVATFEANIVKEMQWQAFGYQFAIAQNGQLAASDGKGFAVSSGDLNYGPAILMEPTMKMELASVTKNITAVATMKLLRRNHLTVNSLVWPYLPSNWTLGDGIKQLKFKHLLTHTSGFNQAIKAMDNPPTDNSWAAMRAVVENGTVVDSARQYKNANFALLRVIDAKLWDRSGGARYIGNYRIKVNALNHTSFVLEYMRKFIFEPAGLYNIGCIKPGTTTGVRSYGAGAISVSNGKVLGTGSGECAGARGLALSAVQLVQYLAHLRHGSIIEDADLATMDALEAGWSSNSRNGNFWHGGDLLGSVELHTCAMTFKDGTEATLLVNSPLLTKTPCGVLLKAWTDAVS